MKTIFEIEEIEQKEMESYIDYLIEVSESIKQNEVTILTGRNAGGKSFIRKLLGGSIGKQLNKEKVSIPHASQELRTNTNPNLGALSGFAHDLEWLATSDNTISTIKNCLKQTKMDFLVLDEPEIGLGEELQLGLMNYLNGKLKKLHCGVLIITHSKNTVKHLKHDKFINLEKMTEEEWLNREIKPLRLDDFKQFSTNLFTTIRDRINRNKNKKKK
jgi:ABC-type Mn2+/Zn2+ transport system ATPase subunit